MTSHTQTFVDEDKGLTFSLTVNLHADKTLTIGTCPFCGTTGLYNVVWEQQAQFAQHADETASGDYAVDDLASIEPAFIRCGGCSKVLFDREAETRSFAVESLTDTDRLS